MEQLKQLLKIPYRVIFTNKEEFLELISARGFKEDTDFLSFEDEEQWINTVNKQEYKLKINSTIFNSDNKLKVFTKEEWNPNFITVEIKQIKDDDLPF